MLIVVRGLGLYLLIIAVLAIPPLLNCVQFLVFDWEMVFGKERSKAVSDRFQMELVSCGTRMLISSTVGLLLLWKRDILQALRIPEYR